jgi:hypothetical protein
MSQSESLSTEEGSNWTVVVFSFPAEGIGHDASSIVGLLK